MKNKGVTLVALIITIIILLILATVSISLVINNNILDKAQHGVDKYSEEEELEQIKLAFWQAKQVKDKPTCIIAKTIKGKGVSFMENKVEWHGKAPNEEQYIQAMKELN